MKYFSLQNTHVLDNNRHTNLVYKSSNCSLNLIYKIPD